jgi:hypothetical protein
MRLVSPERGGYQLRVTSVMSVTGPAMNAAGLTARSNPSDRDGGLRLHHGGRVILSPALTSKGGTA